jgi:hypothetical protein
LKGGYVIVRFNYRYVLSLIIVCLITGLLTYHITAKHMYVDKDEVLVRGFVESFGWDIESIKMGMISNIIASDKDFYDSFKGSNLVGLKADMDLDFTEGQGNYKDKRRICTMTLKQKGLYEPLRCMVGLYNERVYIAVIQCLERQYPRDKFGWPINAGYENILNDLKRQQSGNVKNDYR